MINIGKLSKNGKDVILKRLDNGCIECVSHCKDDLGYTRIYIDGKHQRLFRVLYENRFGKIENGLVVRHKCDNPSCCNIEHLELGTYIDNINDMVIRNRTTKNRNNIYVRGMNNSQSKLTNDDVIHIYQSKEDYSKISKMYNISKTMVYYIKKQKYWKWLTDTISE